MDKQSIKYQRWIPDGLFWGIALLLLCLRFFHFGEPIDSPHAWRQSDIANLIWSFYKDGIDLFHPTVCWMGGHKTLLLNFPLFESFVAILYKVFGPSHLLARGVFFLLFIASAAYFYRLLKHLLTEQQAKLSLLIYLGLPLSIFYSRAIHIDFGDLFLVFGFAVHLLRSIDTQSRKHLFISSAFAMFALLIKGPYLLIPLPFLLYITIQKNAMRFLLRNSWVFVFPALAFLGWVTHSYIVNSNAPDWEFIVGYRKFDSNAGWYFGTIPQRLTLSNWQVLGDRVFVDVSGHLGAVFALMGLGICFRYKKYVFLLWWSLGTVLYTILFFNLNLVHNYYQIPLLPVVAALIAISITHLLSPLPKGLFAIGTTVIAMALIAMNFSYANENFYKENPVRSEIGNKIQQETAPDDLVILSSGGLTPQCPLLLYPSRRNGWSIRAADITPEVVLKLRLEADADYLTLVRVEKPEGELARFIDFFQTKTIPLSNGENIFLTDLNRTADGSTYNPDLYQ